MTSSPKSVSDTAHSSAAAAPSAWYVSAMERLLGVVQELSQAHSVDAVTAIVRKAARELTGADGATFVLRDGDQCHYADEDAIEPLWKGLRFPMSACISGWVMLNGRSAVIEDIYSDPRIPADAYRPTFVKSLAMVPIRRADPIGAIGNYWATRRLPTAEEVAVLQALADTTSVALQNAALYADLENKIETLDRQSSQIREQRDALEVFTHALAHDLKEPVRSIRSFSELIQDPKLPPEKTRQYFKYIKRASERMGMLVDTVFIYTQLDEQHQLPKRRVSLSRIFETACENFSPLIRARNATITFGALPEIEANPAQLLMVVQNLISNAILHSETPVTIDVTAEETAEGWRICVRDNGPGIDAAQTAKIFEPFKRLTAHNECAGLGLSICRKILNVLGGKIWCESASGAGASFYMTFPKYGAASVPANASVPAVPPVVRQPGALANVLLVDDLEDHMELTRLMLFESIGLKCNVSTARNGKEALDVIGQAADAGNPIDLVLLDINMPEMDGFEAMEHLRSDVATKDTTVVMCTGSTYDKDRERARTLGAAGYLVKPPSWNDLTPIIQRIPLSMTKDDDGVSLSRG